MADGLLQLLKGACSPPGLAQPSVLAQPSLLA